MDIFIESNQKSISRRRPPGWLSAKKRFTIGTVCRCRHSFFHQKCVVLYVLDKISWFYPSPPHPHPHPSPPSLTPIPLPSSPPLNSQWEYENLCVYVQYVHSVRTCTLLYSTPSLFLIFYLSSNHPPCNPILFLLLRIILLFWSSVFSQHHLVNVLFVLFSCT